MFRHDWNKEKGEGRKGLYISTTAREAVIKMRNLRIGGVDGSVVRQQEQDDVGRYCFGHRNMKGGVTVFVWRVDVSVAEMRGIGGWWRTEGRFGWAQESLEDGKIFFFAADGRRGQWVSDKVVQGSGAVY